MDSGKKTDFSQSFNHDQPVQKKTAVSGIEISFFARCLLKHPELSICSFEPYNTFLTG